MYAAAFLIYATTRAFTWDESYHLLAAQLIGAGKTPYLDFCFPQTPLNAYWNAAWMRLLGQSWRVPHILAALLTVGASGEYMLNYIQSSRFNGRTANNPVSFGSDAWVAVAHAPTVICSREGRSEELLGTADRHRDLLPTRAVPMQRESAHPILSADGPHVAAVDRCQSLQHGSGPVRIDLPATTPPWRLSWGR